MNASERQAAVWRRLAKQYRKNGLEGLARRLEVAAWAAESRMERAA